MATPALASQAALARPFPSRNFNARERKVLASVKVYVDAGIAPGAIVLAQLAPGITPSHVIKFAGKHTTTGGSPTEAFTVTGVLSTDIVMAVLQAKGATPRTILTVAPTTDTITLVFSGDPSTDHIVAYEVIRAAS